MPRVLICDDPEGAFQAYGFALGAPRFAAEFVESGEAALRRVQQGAVDVLVLATELPDLHGGDVLRRLKTDPALPWVPVLVVSSMKDTSILASLFQTGADDYLLKPVNPGELVARVERLVLRKQESERHQEHSRRQEALRRKLEQELATKGVELEALYERLAVLDHAKSDFLRLIAHELRTPATGLFGVCDLILDKPMPPEAFQDLRRVYLNSRTRMHRIIEHALLLTQIEVGDGTIALDPVPLMQTLQNAALLAQPVLESKQCGVKFQPQAPGELVVRGDAGLLAKGFAALIETVAKFSRDGAPVTVAWDVDHSFRRIVFQTKGLVLDPPHLEKLFDPFSISEPIIPGGDLGLAPTLAKRLLQLFQGRVRAFNRSDGLGMSIRVLLPGA